MQYEGDRTLSSMRDSSFKTYTSCPEKVMDCFVRLIFFVWHFLHVSPGLFSRLVQIRFRYHILQPSFAEPFLFISLYQHWSQWHWTHRVGVGLQHHFFTEPDFDYDAVLFLNDNSARACSVALALAELTRVGEPNCLYEKKVVPAGRVTLPSKDSELLGGSPF